MGTGKLMMPYLLIIVLPHKFSITKLYRLANMVNHDILVILLILIGCATLPLCSSNKCITLTALCTVQELYYLVKNVFILIAIFEIKPLKSMHYSDFFIVRALKEQFFPMVKLLKHSLFTLLLQ